MLLFDDDRWCGNGASVSGPTPTYSLAVNMPVAHIAVTPAVFYDQVIRRSSCACIKQGCVGTTRTLNP